MERRGYGGRISGVVVVGLGCDGGINGCNNAACDGASTAAAAAAASVASDGAMIKSRDDDDDSIVVECEDEESTR